MKNKTFTRFMCFLLLKSAIPFAFSVFFFTVLATPFARAGNDCGSSENVSVLLTCAQTDFQAAEKRLRTLATKILHALPETSKPIFQKAQDAWLAYRDAECSWNAVDLTRGPQQELARLTCIMEMTKSRGDDLEIFLRAP